MSILDKKWNRDAFDYTSWSMDMYWYVKNYGEWIDLNLDEDDLLKGLRLICTVSMRLMRVGMNDS